MTRFRRTKAEIEAGLSPESAASLRIGLKQAKAGELFDGPKLRKVKDGGEIVIRIRPAKGVDADYFEHLDNKTITVEQDEAFYKWLDHYLDKVYDEAGKAKLFQDILDKGIGELITRIHFAKDIE